MAELQLNLYEAFLPNEIELTVRNRPEKLLEGEMRWGDTQSVIVQDGLVLPDTSAQAFETSQIAPTIVQRLLSEGLSTSFSNSGMLVERQKLSFNVFHLEDRVKIDYEFIELIRGIAFRSEHVTIQSRGHFAFYASMRLRRRFTIDLADASLREAATGEEVRLHTGERSSRVKLVRTDGVDADVETPELSILRVSTNQIEVAATPRILGRYAKLVNKPEANNRVLAIMQQASYRYSTSGTKLRSWLRAEVDFVGSWLAKASQGGRIPFRLPMSATDCFLGIRPTSVRLR